MTQLSPPKYFPTKYWQTLSDGRIQCDLCPHHCRLKNGQKGVCFVRECQDNAVVLTTYGRSSGFCIDPIEKKPLYHFLPGTPVLSFGTAGCNLACKFCQNWDISKSREIEKLADEAMPEVLAVKAKELQCNSIAYTYNEPIIFMEYAIDVAKACRQYGIKSVAVTNGYICDEPRKEFFRYMDAANVDLKGFTETFYKKITGASLQPVLDTLVYLKKHTNVWLEITTLLIPGLNDSSAEIERSSQWILDHLGPDVPLHFTAFHPAFKMLQTPPTPLETLKNARRIAMKNGLYYVYIGNTYDQEGSSTFCHHCHRCLIERMGYQLTQYNLTEKGHCKFCNTLCKGVFQDSPGTWGAQRKTVWINNI
ncbi:MAG: AmmeMemoRadiSam system radical SAM enzyme [Pseudomonadota bacterium]|nr:AmmeMemoRadiSam system radical SAM enzyme [Gammaproteobacteria bacterium]MBU1927058.1 AmmeMemoRadiSam system radical SAM enzyme [Gammaproteobacteria bacterium]MBU2545871.1 AmmeMemoRadiSam system radical SAM enzyme [Gammaproteobacteria bacterium]